MLVIFSHTRLLLNLLSTKDSQNKTCNKTKQWEIVLKFIKLHYFVLTVPILGHQIVIVKNAASARIPLYKWHEWSAFVVQRSERHTVRTERPTKKYEESVQF